LVALVGLVWLAGVMVGWLGKHGVPSNMHCVYTINTDLTCLKHFCYSMIKDQKGFSHHQTIFKWWIQ